MQKVIKGMGKIEFGRFYNPNNRIINSAEETPILESTLTKEIYWKQLRNFLDNDYIYSLLTHRKTINVYKTKAINLLSKYRFDIFVKYYYVRCYIENHNLKEATDIYLSHIKAFNNFQEPDGRKNGADIFLQNFNNLIENIRTCNNLDKTIIPISMTGIPIDGAHRIAISLYLGIEVNYCVFDLLDGKFDEDFFKQRGMPSEYIYKINQLAEELCSKQKRSI